MNEKILFDEAAFKQLPEQKRLIFIYEWLKKLEKIFEEKTYDRSEIKKNQKQIVTQIQSFFLLLPGPPIRNLIAKNISIIFELGDILCLYDSIEYCNNILKSKEETKVQKLAKLCSLNVLGCIYERLGRMVGRSYEGTIQILVKCLNLKSIDVEIKIEILISIEKIIKGINTAGVSIYKELYTKQLKSLLCDNSLDIRCASANVLTVMTKHASFLYTIELENLILTSFKSLEISSCYSARSCISKLIGNLLYHAVKSDELIKYSNNNSSTQPQSQISNTDLLVEKKIEQAFSILSSGFSKNKTRFLKVNKKDESNSTSQTDQELRIGLTYAYVEFIRLLGSSLLDKHLSTYINSVLELIKNCRGFSTEIEIITLRKCVNYIFRSTIGLMLNERSQITAAKEIIFIIKKHVETDSSISFKNNDVSSNGNKLSDEKSRTNSTELNLDNILICLMNELSYLIIGLNTSSMDLITDSSLGFIETILSTLKYPSNSVKLSTAWCLRCLCVTLPILMSPILEICMNRLSNSKVSSDTIISYGFACTTLLGGVHLCTLGIPHLKIKLLFNIGEELLCTASQNARTCVQKICAGWLLLGSFMTLGSSMIKKYLPRMIVLWKNTMPRNVKELEIEKKRNDPITWFISLESRSGALASMNSFLLYSNEIFVNDETIRKRILNVVEGGILVLSQLNQIIKVNEAYLKESANTFRYRLFQTLLNLPLCYYEEHFTILKKEIITIITSIDSTSNRVTSLFKNIFNANKSILFGQEIDEATAEYQIQPNFLKWPSALEYDYTYIYLKIEKNDGNALPLDISIIDSSINLLSRMFPKLSNKCQLEIIQTFVDNNKNIKQNVQENVFAAFLWSLKALAESKCNLQDENAKKLAFVLITDTLAHSNPVLRCSAAEALGRLSEIISDSKFVTEIAQFCFDKLKNVRDIGSRTGYSLGLGYLHRCIGGMGAGQHLTSSISILFALSQDSTSKTVQAWAIQALYLLADSGGSMFRNFIEPSFLFIVQSIFSIENHHQPIYVALGKFLGALITLVGPELQNNTPVLSEIRKFSLLSCLILQIHIDPTVKAEAIQCLQKLYLFSPKSINLKDLVLQLMDTIRSSDHCLLKATISCIRQLCQKEATEVSNLARNKLQNNSSIHDKQQIKENGLENLLLKLLDTETDDLIVNEIHDILNSMLTASLTQQNMKQWIILCKETAIASFESNEALKKTKQILNKKAPDSKSISTEPKKDEETSGKNSQIDGEDNEGNLDEQLATSVKNDKNSQFNTQLYVPKWPNRVFAIKLIRQIISICNSLSENVKELHFDLKKAQQRVELYKNEDYLILHLSELIRISCVSCISSCDPLKMAGLELIQDIISYFSKSKEPELPDYLILEQYQAQIGAALKPQFSIETSAYVTAVACRVCSSWISCGVARSLSDLRRVYQLLVISLQKLMTNSKTSSNSSINSIVPFLGIIGTDQSIYSELSLTVEKLAVLRSWAEVYIVAIEQDKTEKESLLTLVQPELNTLSQHWSMVLKDFALLSVPNEYTQQLPIDGGVYFHPDLMESSKLIYKEHWIIIMHAFSIWIKNTNSQQIELVENNVKVDEIDETEQTNKSNNKENTLVFTILGICVENLAKPISIDFNKDSVEYILKSIFNILNSPDSIKSLEKSENEEIYVDLLSVLYSFISIENESKRDKIESIYLVSLDICFHNLSKYFPLKKSDSNDNYNNNPSHQSLTNEDSELLIETFSIFDTLFDHYSSNRKGYKFSKFVSVLYLAVINLLKSKTFVVKLECDECLFKSMSNLLVKLISIGNSNCNLCLDELEEKIRINYLHQSGFLEFLSIEHNNVSVLKLLFTIVVFIPIEVMKAPVIFEKIKSVMSNYRKSNDKKVVLSFLTCLKSLMKTSIARELCISILKDSLSYFLQYDVHKSITADNSVLEEFYSCFESFLEFILTQENVNTGNDLLEILINILCMHLIEMQSSLINKTEKKWIFALKKLINLAQKHSISFKRIVDKNTIIKDKIESALKEYKEIEKNNQNDSQNNKNISNARESKGKPKIELKIKF